ncbi:Acyl-CoA oxidase/dehydrogenase, central domain protein [Kalmanozyma brasiliensis GHG001]|uniref:Acyl-coenzyme A oxidase n=1 Tax=Kalmanozyma brasiliensis (strain GHG001) TaxID=1365824 RepID=V5GPM5_KALBG|nr:Acyl-CoA oxidase/dehydrogenase, central domain protein [Kalmanozyma brasiliensis GHG001]EST07912.1 Acyl-CoA oxidase/dehydrogenase, central domain protein [Kalmanozyma brasiliensis GHG001]
MSKPDPKATTYEPLNEGVGEWAPARVTLPIPMGEVAARTSVDMATARAAASFDPTRIEETLRDARIDNESRIKVMTVLSKDPIFANWKKRMPHMNREQQMRQSHFACRRILELGEQNEWTTHEIVEAVLTLDLQSPITIHWVAFVPVIFGQGNAEQIERWGEKAMNHEILGCYMQTELGHGTNVQQLETTCTYDEESDGFVLHSPTLTSTKWWAGGLGTTSTHGIVQAQLIIKGKSYGPHLFFCQLRDMETGKLLDGLVAGDIGPKTYGAFGGLDNGWARFDHFKIPRDHMLSKHAKVKKGGEYVKPPSDKLSYGGMIFIRSQMIDRTGWMLSRGVTIATRYTLVRRQFRDPSSKDVNDVERSVLSYPSTARRILPLLAKAYAYILAGRRMRTLYEDMAQQLEEGNTELLADVHVASSSLKAYCTKQALDGIEECRQALGGHGFLASAGFTQVFPEQAPAVTYEGDNIVLASQVGRAMLKLSGELDGNSSAKVAATSGFLKAISQANAIPFTQPKSSADWYKPEVYSAALGLRAAQLVVDLRAEIKSGRPFVDLSFECIEVAKSHAEFVVDLWFGEGIRDDAQRLGEKECAWLNKLVTLHALTALSRNITPLVLPASQGRALAGYKTGQAILAPESVILLEKAIRELVTEILPQVIGLSDGFGWLDWELGSSLGRKDGRVYEHLMADAEANPLNHPGAVPSLETIDKVGIYKYGSANTGKGIPDWYGSEIGPLLTAAARRANL